MKQIIKSPAEVQVIDLVLDPFAYYDALIASLCPDERGSTALEHLANILPAAIAQLDAVGDVYGALALVGLSVQLTWREARPVDEDDARLAGACVPFVHVVAESY